MISQSLTKSSLSLSLSWASHHFVSLSLTDLENLSSLHLLISLSFCCIGEFWCFLWCVFGERMTGRENADWHKWHFQTLCQIRHKWQPSQQLIGVSQAPKGLGQPCGTRCIDGAISEKDKLPSGELNESYASLSFGHLSPPSSCDLSSNWGVFEKVFKLDRPCMVDEIHLRRFDGLLGNGGVHRCVVASITVKAPVREVWNVLTDYESLPEIVPNLAISKILSRDNNKVRIVQTVLNCPSHISGRMQGSAVYGTSCTCCVGFVRTHLEQEISFEQVEGDFDFFQGKWVLEELGNHHTLLKYSVESKMHKNSLLSEAIMEEISRFQRSWGMDPSFMPSRKSFECAGRYDIARALEKWGGLHEVSRLLSLKMRHPNRQGNLSKDKKIDYVASNNANGEGKAPSKPYVSQYTHKWLIKLKDLDLNWSE
ncbi:Polyketide cyclase [Actinidia chinensis var. chinensis]|uniref:Polyketide cyclase n=1 Tax=Actinidia chinensis var. chinensis TaxID=1590841 RepID=A0A2R6RJN3_ACTCC|nr:Polyketide cyclase [Actinidia chinensis var. chinensis]